MRRYHAMMASPCKQGDPGSGRKKDAERKLTLAPSSAADFERESV